MSELDKGEHQRLEAAIKASEELLAHRPQLQTNAAAVTIDAATKRLSALESEGIEGFGDKDRRKKNAQDMTAIAVLVMQEAKLTAAEKQVYAEFLHKEHFTRSDFGNLSVFYADAGAWDRLSERGKREMSDRIWAGVERGEYQFNELPDDVRRKEVEQMTQYIANPEQAPEYVKRMPPEAKAAFIQAYKDGDKAKAQEILSSEDLFEQNSKNLSQPASQRSELDGSGVEDKSSKSEKDERNAEELGLLASIPATSLSTGGKSAPDKSPSI